MNPLLKIFWFVYLGLIYYPLGVLATFLCAITTIIGCAFGNCNIWGYYPGMVWSRFMCLLAWCKVTVRGKENLRKGQSYIFASNHTSMYDIYLLYGYLGVCFKWIMKQEVRKMPFVGKACESAGFLFINRSKGREAFKTLEEAKKKLTGGVSLVIFPEGTRTRDGKTGKFKRGAFEIARTMELPIIPTCIEGAYSVMPYNRSYPVPGHITLTLLEETAITEADHDEERKQIDAIRDKIVAVVEKEQA